MIEREGVSVAKTKFTGSRPPAPLLLGHSGHWWVGGREISRRVGRSRRDELCSGLRDVSAREKGVGAMGEHNSAEVPNEGKGLGVKVAKHGVGAPAAHQPDGVGVDVAAEKGHGATSAEAAGIDIVGGKAQS